MKRKYVTEEQKEIKKFIYVLLGVILIVIGIYFFTKAFVTKDLFKDTDIPYQTGSVNDSVLIVGTLLNRPEKEYYVIAYSSTDTNMAYYNSMMSKYMEEEDAQKIYFLDLDNALNKEYVAEEESNASKTFTKIEDLKLGNLTLLKIKNGKVNKMLLGEEEIKKELGV